MARHVNAEQVAEEIGRLADLPRELIVQRWTKTHGHPPPKYSSLTFMRKSLAYELQVDAFGGLSETAKRALKSAAMPKASDRSSKKPQGASTPPMLRAGTRLVREWNGRTYQVEVLEDGFSLDGKSYRSLSAIAGKITGARWSGPRFFGLVAR